MFLQSFKDVNQYLNNTTTFLLDISVPIIHYLLHKNDDFEEQLQEVCKKNRRFSSQTLEPDLFEKTNDFLQSMSYASEYVGCTCHNKSWVEFHQEITGPLHGYCLSLFRLIDQNNFHAKLVNDDFRFS